jgi:hypothetical protein
LVSHCMRFLMYFSFSLFSYVIIHAFYRNYGITMGITKLLILSIWRVYLAWALDATGMSGGWFGTSKKLRSEASSKRKSAINLELVHT